VLRVHQRLQATDGGVGGDEQREPGAEVGFQEDGDRGVSAVAVRPRGGGHRGGGAAMKAIINTEVAVNKVGIIKTPNHPM